MFVFFFKQKTAYEMRISDWSSDVCSSDLNQAGLERTQNDVLSGDDDRLFVSRLVDLVNNSGAKDGSVKLTIDRKAQVAAYKGLLEIGRASCRERVCQYV